MKIILGRYTHNGIALLVDNIQITQRTTSAPTPYPTFAPTKSKNAGPTIQPTRLTESPTTSNILSCPLPGNSPLVIPSGPIMLRTAGTNTLCTLTKIISSDTGEAISIPIARSYSNNPWEKSAGEASAYLFAGKDILCYEAGCQINLPILEESEAEFRLSTHIYELSKVDEAARFLETATFGITSEELVPFSVSSNDVKTDILTWISQQMNSSITPMTSHREFWRKGLNGRVSSCRKFGSCFTMCP